MATSSESQQRLCSRCRIELEPGAMFCSNCGFKFINDDSSSSSKAKNLAEEKMNAMLSKMSLKSLKDFNWLSEKEAMYGLLMMSPYQIPQKILLPRYAVIKTIS